MSSIAVGSSSSSNGTSRNILKILSNRHRDSFNGLYAHFAEECSYFSNTPKQQNKMETAVIWARVLF